MIGRAGNKMVHEEGSGTAMMEARGVEKTYAAGGATVRALRGVNLSVPHGEMAAVTGLPGTARRRS